MVGARDSVRAFEDHPPLAATYGTLGLPPPRRLADDRVLVCRPDFPRFAF